MRSRAQLQPHPVGPLLLALLGLVCWAGCSAETPRSGPEVGAPESTSESSLESTSEASASAAEAEAVAPLVLLEVGGGSLARAGLRVGDGLMAWRRQAEGAADAGPLRGASSWQRLRSPLHLEAAEFAGAPGHHLELEVRRGAEELVVAVPPGRWRGEVAPALAGQSLEHLANLRELARSLGAEAGPEPGDEGPTASGLLGAADEWIAQVEGELAGRADLDPGAVVAWGLLEIADAVPRSGAGTPGAVTFAALRDRALARLSAAGSSASTVLPVALGRASRQTVLWGDYAMAMQLRERATTLFRELDEPGGLGQSLMLTARLESLRGRPEAAEERARASLEVLERVSPASVEVQRALRQLAQAIATQGDHYAAAEIAERCVAIAEAVAPEGLDHSAALVLRGIFAWYRNDLEYAEAQYLAALRILEQIDPSHPDRYGTLRNLGLVASRRGDWMVAEQYYLRAGETVVDDPLRKSQGLTDLGTMARARRDFEAAERWHRRVLEIREAAVPGSAALAVPLFNLGETLAAAGRLEEATGYLERALELELQHLPHADDAHLTQLVLARVERDEGRLEQAASRVQRALEVLQRDFADRTFGGSMGEAHALTLLSSIRREQGRTEDAVVAARRGVVLAQRIEAGTTDHALAVLELAQALLAAGQSGEALQQILATLDILEDQARRLGGSDEVRLEYRREFSYVYRLAIELLLDEGRTAEAFEVLQRSQARTLLALLAERGLSGTARQVQLWQRDPALAARLDELNERRDALRRELASLRLSREAFLPSSQALRSAGEHGSALDATQASLELDLEAIDAQRSAIASREEQQVAISTAQALTWLAEETAVLSYAVGDDRVEIFVLRAGSGGEEPPEPVLFHVSQTLPRRELEDRIARFRILLEGQPMHSEQRPELGYLSLARELAADLIDPVQQHLYGATELILVPDGPLHHLPFAALTPDASGRSAMGEEGGQFLLERYSLQIAASLPSYSALRSRAVSDRAHSAEVQGSERAGSSGAPDPETGAKGPNSLPPAAERDRRSDSSLVAFANPRIGAQEASLRNLVAAAGQELASLPHAQREAESIRQVFSGHTLMLLGNEASETRARDLQGWDVVHFATHGFFDPRSPLDSGLVLSGGTDGRGVEHNGLLQAWEIFDRVRLDSDLVTLSACETALGRDLEGEGLLSLTRAFQHAGARSVVATLWRVRDDSTAVLMRRVYTHLASGLARHEALRTAQLELLRGEVEGAAFAARERGPFWRRFRRSSAPAARDLSHPFYWAGFQLYGDGGSSLPRAQKR